MENEATWSYIMATLTIRFVGVFVVLGILQIGMSISGALVSRYLARRKG